MLDVDLSYLEAQATKRVRITMQLRMTNAAYKHTQVAFNFWVFNYKSDSNNTRI